MEVVPGTTRDADAVADLWVDLASEQTQYGSHVLPADNRASIREQAARHAATDCLVVARVDDEVVGFVMFDVSDGGVGLDVAKGLVENLYVVPRMRDQGIGARLLREAERRLAERGVDVVSLEAMADNEAARRFYRRHGYDRHRVELEKPVESDTHSKEDG
jgi:ribosomal protein S18 acetylase RimI-like enzyme